MQFNEQLSWIDSSGPNSDVVISCRARLARNIAGFNFVSKSGDTEARQLSILLRDVLLDQHLAPDMIWVDMARATRRDRRLLAERHLISRELAEGGHHRAVAVSGDEHLSIMINEEDHLRIQVLAAGLQLATVHTEADEVDDFIEQRLDYAFSNRWGYLTACPTNVGTGTRFSVMLHLPGLKITNEIERVRRAAKDLHLAVRGYYGEGSDSAGDFYQISNQLTLGRSEQELLEELNSEILPRIIDYERQARRMLAEKNPSLLDDRVYRSAAILGSARLLGIEEAMKLLSRLRLGIALDRIDVIDLDTINRLFLQVQPAHLQMQSEKTLSQNRMREARADLVREALAGRLEG